MAFKEKGDQAKYHKEVWYPKNKERRVQLNREWRERNRALYDDYKKTLCCKLCGEDESSCLDFHHLDPTKKEYSISSAPRHKSFKKIMEEIEKCIVLCSNCHRKVHAGVIVLPD